MAIYTLNYNPASAVAYARIFGERPGENVFPYWNETGKTNCTNFVSQCVWAGFGGNSQLSALNADTYPMHRSINNATYLYNGWNLSNSSVYSKAWGGTLSIWSYALLQNGFDTENTPTTIRWLANTYGKGNENSDYADTCTLDTLPEMDYAGAIIIGGKNGTEPYAHAIFAVSGTNRSNIRFAANSESHSNTLLFKTNGECYFSNWENNRLIHIIKPTQYIFSTPAVQSVNFRSNYVMGETGASLLHSGAEITAKSLYSIGVTISNSSGDIVRTLSNVFHTSYYSFHHTYTTQGIYTITVSIQETSTSAVQTHTTYALIL